MLLLVGMALFACRAVAAEPATELTPVEVAGRARIAAAWVEAGRWCVRQELGDEARFCLERAREASLDARGLESLAKLAPDCPAGESGAAWDKRRAAVGRKVAGYLDRLHGALAGEPAAEVRVRSVDYALQALVAHPTLKRWKRTSAAIEAALASEEAVPRIPRWTETALALDPPEEFALRLEASMDRALTGRLVLRRATTHPICYYISLPEGYHREEGRRWPVLLAVEGAGCNFEGMGRGYMKHRGDRRFIIVSPCTFSNTNLIEGATLETYQALYADDVIVRDRQKRLAWDEAGILAIVTDLQDRFDAGPGLHVTGFSGGGNVAYMLVFKHPDLVVGAAPACANFGQPGYASLHDEFTAEDRSFPIRILTGARDPHRDYTHGDRKMPGIEPQTDTVVAVLEALEYSDWTRTMVPDLAHSAAHQRVIAELFGAEGP